MIVNLYRENTKSEEQSMVEILWIDNEYIECETWFDSIQSNRCLLLETFETSSC